MRIGRDPHGPHSSQGERGRTVADGWAFNCFGCPAAVDPTQSEPTKFEFVVNLTTAKALGLGAPFPF
jgi:hypothetical protein